MIFKTLEVLLICVYLRIHFNQEIA